VQEDGSIYGQYHVIERIAVGGMAEIYLGIALGVEGFERKVVIKKVRQRFSSDSRFHSMLVKEAKICASLNHPNIVQILDLGQNDREEYFIVMEYVDGWDLRSVMDRLEERGERLHPDLVLYIAREICAALDYAHNKTDPNGKPLRLIHRDVSPSNILISRGGEVKLADFGIARYGRDVSVVGSLKGKLAYMSPEQARSELLDHRTDLFSIGAVMYENLCGRRVFDAESDLELLEQVRIGRIAPLRAIDPSLPEGLEQLLRRALETNPEARYPSAEKMAAAIASFQFENSSKRVTPEQLASMMGTLFPESRGSRPPEPEVPVFTVTTKVELRDPVFAEQYASAESAPLPAGPASDRSIPSFLEVVTEPGRPPPQLLAELKRTDRQAWPPAPHDTEENPLEAINTDEQYPPPLLPSDQTLEEAITPAKRHRPQLPTFRPEDIRRDDDTQDERPAGDALEDASTELAPPGLDTMRRQLLGKRPVFSGTRSKGGERPAPGVKGAPSHREGAGGPRDTDARRTEPHPVPIEDQQVLSSLPTHILDRTPAVEEAGPPASALEEHQRQHSADKTPVVEPADPPTHVVLERQGQAGADDAPTSVATPREPEDAPTSVAAPSPEDAPTSIATRPEPEDAPTRVVKEEESPTPASDAPHGTEAVEDDKALMAAMAAIAAQPTKILEDAPPRDEPVPPALEAQSTFVIKRNDSSPFAMLATDSDFKPAAAAARPRRWAWLLVAIFGLSIGGGAALLLLMPQSPFNILGRKDKVPKDAPAQPRPEGKGAVAQATAGDADSGGPAAGQEDRTASAGVKLAEARPDARPARRAKRGKDGRSGYYTGRLKDRSDPPRTKTRPKTKATETTKPPKPKPKKVKIRVARRVDPPEPPTRPTPRRRATGSVVIKSDPWAYIHVDGRDTKRTTSAQAFTVPAGKHRIELVNPALDLRKTITVDVPPDGLVRRFVRLR
jgi:serine/threonine protein kinase